MREADGKPFFADPRAVLGNLQERFRQEKLIPHIAMEMEFYVIDRQRRDGFSPQLPIIPRTQERETQTQGYALFDLDNYHEFVQELLTVPQLQDLPVKGVVAEFAPGQFEVNLRHQPDAVKACDQALLLRRLVRGVANKFGFDVTFMAKPFAEHAGNGMHVHLSLANERHKNVFCNKKQQPSRELHHVVGGLIEFLPDCTLLFAPHVNSFRRFEEGSFAPANMAWGVNNRTTALRIPHSQPEALRIEHRVAGADANPYLVVAGILAGAHYGLQHKLQPPPAVEGNAYVRAQPQLLRDWTEARLQFEDAKRLRRYLGGAFCDLYAALKAEEQRKFYRAITRLEYDWYLRAL